MKRLILLLLLAVPAFAGYGFRRSITVDRTKVPNTDQTNFPMLACFNGGTGTNCDGALGTLSVPNLKTVGNGGKVTDAQADDVVFSTDTGCSLLLNWEVERYDGTTGELLAWVRIPTLTTGSDFRFYMCYANAAISSFQGGAAGTAWNSSIKRVYHLPNGTSLSAAESTAAGDNGALNNAPTAVAGQIDGAGNFVSASMQYISATGTGLPTTGTMSAECWIKTTDTIPAGGWMISWGAGGTNTFLAYGTVSKISAWGDAGTTLIGLIPVGDGNWHHIAGTYNGSNSRKLYVDGVLDQSDGNTMTSGTTGLAISTNQNAVATFLYGGAIDEVRIYNSELSIDWIKTEVNNQGTPSTFYAVGAEVFIGGSGGARRVIIL